MQAFVPTAAGVTSNIITAWAATKERFVSGNFLRDTELMVVLLLVSGLILHCINQLRIIVFAPFEKGTDYSFVQYQR